MIRVSTTDGLNHIWIIISKKSYILIISYSFCPNDERNNWYISHTISNEIVVKK